MYILILQKQSILCIPTFENVLICAIKMFQYYQVLGFEGSSASLASPGFVLHVPKQKTVTAVAYFPSVVDP